MGLFGKKRSFEIRDVEAQPLWAMRVRCAYTEVAEHFAHALRSAWVDLQSRGITPAGQPCARYLEMGPDAVEIAVGLPIAEPLEARATVEGGGELYTETLPAGRVVSTWHVGPYETLPQTYAAMGAWVQKEGLTPAGPHWDHYVTDPGAEPDPSQWRTEVLCPLAD